MTTLGKLYETGVNALKTAGYDDAVYSVRILLEELLGASAAVLYAHPERPVASEDEKRLILAVERIAEGEPLGYVLGHSEFMGLSFTVDPSVLIPRPETENLVEWILEEQKEKEACFLDIGTGSGAIAISLLTFDPAMKGVACDISEQALKTACKNAQDLEVSDRLIFCQSDLFTNVPETRFDFIVSNPPYITGKDMEELPPPVQREPETALYGGPDGLDIYRRIIRKAKEHLVPGGAIYFEIGYDQGQSVPGLLQAQGFTDIEVRKDYAGLDRMVHAHAPSND